ncbi:glutamine synthetase [Streptomyces griseoluteus]|uniref:glutamine synthetase n=1 Tax=Streptomyces griseoluteus TaxID=29306 RepID=UPI0036C643C1
MKDRAGDPSDPIRSVWMSIVDPHGRLKGKQYGVQYFLDEVAGHNVEMCGYLVDSDGQNRPVPDLPNGDWSSGYPDIEVFPCLPSLALMPGQPGAAHLFAIPMNSSGGPLAISPHSILRRQLNRLNDLGLLAQIGLETEFVLYQGTREDMHRTGYSAPSPVASRNLDYSADAPPAVHDYLDSLAIALADSGHPVEALKLEGAPGQVEVTFPYRSDVEDVCHQHLRMQTAAMRLAERQGMTASFMAAPETGVGNGLHIHLSLWDKDTPCFAGQPGDEPEAILGAALGGLLEALPDLTPLYAPAASSYRRYTDESFAPTALNWGHDNRTCAVRLVGKGASRHLEVRVPGADANPLLAVAAVIGGVVEGIERNLHAPDAVTGNGYRSGAPRVAGSLHKALKRFRDSALAINILGPDVVTHYDALGQHAVRIHDREVSDVDRRLWYSRA